VVRASPAQPGALGVGAGTSSSVVHAWWKALAEAFASRSAAVKLELVGEPRFYGPHGDGVVTFDDHLRYYADHARSHAADFLDASPDVARVGAVPALDGPDE